MISIMVWFLVSLLSNLFGSSRVKVRARLFALSMVFACGHRLGRNAFPFFCRAFLQLHSPSSPRFGRFSASPHSLGLAVMAMGLEKSETVMTNSPRISRHDRGEQRWCRAMLKAWEIKMTPDPLSNFASTLLWLTWNASRQNNDDNKMAAHDL